MVMLDTIERDAVLESDEMATRQPKGQGDATPRSLFTVKGTVEWYEWLKRFADSEGVSAMTLIDLALREKARKAEFEAMPKRTGRAAG